MATFISVPLKKSSEVELVKPLSKFVTATYPAGEEQAEYLRSVDELNKLRKSALGRPLDKHESSLEILLRYYDQLCSVEPKFPFSENQLCLTFTWKDAFDKGSLFSGSVKLALASQIASEQNLDNDEGLKTAAKFYQLASGAFGHIRDTVLSALNREPTMDISPETVGTLSNIMLAQAQEMKDAVIAKLANQAADYYGDAFKQCQYKDNLPKEVLPVLAAKHCIMQANAELHQSILAKQKKRFGEEIARLQHAAELVKTVATSHDEYVSVKDLTEKINRALTAAKKDNDFIYHDRVPEVKDLEHIGKAALVKPTAITPPLSQKFADLFEKMVPMAVQQSMSIYGQRKAETVNRLVGTMREATNLCNGYAALRLSDQMLLCSCIVLASLNLPAALEDLSGDSIPQSIAEKARAVVQLGGLQSIEQLIRDLPELLTRNREILDEGSNFSNILDKAVQADQVVRDRYNAHCDMITLLCKPENELNAAIPSANPTKTLQGSEVVNVLRSQLAQLDEMKRERETLEGEIKAVTFDMSTVFLTSLAQDGAISEEQMSLSKLDQLYGAYNQRVQATLRTQEELLGQVQTSHQEFSSLKQSNTEANQREEVLKKLASAHDSYVEISNNLREGTKFYNDLTEILLKFQNKCSDIVFARKTERDELLKYTGQPQQAQQQPPQMKANPPARPPPPSFNPQAASPNPATTPTGPPNSNPPPLAPHPRPRDPLPQLPRMPMGYNPYAYGQYNMPNMPSMPNMPNMPYMPYQQTPGQGGYPAAPPGGQPYPGYPSNPLNSSPTTLSNNSTLPSPPHPSYHQLTPNKK
ncbi:hypothetical protein F7725_025040 [Dissostichus mawsoni]|uniref:Programmed cell death 6-interacting protein n=1 Tax=Dissostichus mawsoni TaxID=36200 RepID=A0A7J5XA03_DISMA|nr:hypothetical protein F7725_025040 [Dissostichus mawsoni]